MKTLIVIEKSLAPAQDQQTYDRITAGYLVTSRLDGPPRTYACANEKGLHDLIVHLTEREPSTFPLRNGLPAISGISIVAGLHIYQ